MSNISTTAQVGKGLFLVLAKVYSQAMEMCVFIDLRHWSPSGFTGIGQVARQATLAMLRQAPGTRFILLAHPQVLAMVAADNVVPLPCEVSLTAHPANEWLEQVQIPRWIARHGANRFLSFENRVPLKAGVPAATWIHDASLVRFPGAHPLKFQLLQKAQIAVTRLRAAAVFAPSSFAVNECAECFAIPRDRLHVAPLGCSLLDYPARTPSPDPYFLCVGATNPRKNLPTLFAAWKMVRKRHPNFTLVLTGSPAEWQRQVQRGLVIPDGVEFRGHVDAPALAALYANCQSAIHPSLYEGFGIPLLDAVEAGVPIACSDIPPHRDILGESGFWFSPTSADSIADSLVHLAESPHSAMARPTRPFHWDACAQAMLGVLENL